jgi:hypothetical protein
MAASDALAVIYILTIFLTQWVMLQWFPTVMRLNYENPPYGLHTIWSDMLDQWINIFSNHRTKLNWVSKRKFQICGNRFRMPLSLMQIIPFLTSMTVVFTLVHYLGDNLGSFQIFSSLRRFNPDEVVDCSQYNDTLISHLPSWAEFFEKYAFQVQSNAANRFKDFKEVFGVFHFLPFSFYFYLLWSTMYNMYLNWYGLMDHLFPVVHGHQMWRSMIQAILDNTISSETDFDTRVRQQQQAIRELMILTSVRNDYDFYGLYDKFKCTPCCRKPYDSAMSKMYSASVNSSNYSRQEILGRLHCDAFMKHPMNLDFTHIIDLCRANDDDLRVFWTFFAARNENPLFNCFDNQMRDLTSHRAKTTFEILGIPLSAYDYKDDL